MSASTPDIASLPTSNLLSTPDQENTLSVLQSGIHDIPPEILIQICSLNAFRDRTPHSLDPYNDTSSETSLPPAVLDTIHASHVCHTWRNILISAPELWANMVDPYDEEWMRVILHRSRPLAITLLRPRGDRYHWQTGEDFKRAMVFQEIQERLVEYHFTQSDNPSRLHRIDHLHLPQLRFLFLELNYGQRLPRNFPGLTTPALEHLYLRMNFTENIERLDMVSSTLTHLTIVDLHPGSKISPQKLVAIINRLPQLQNVTLRGVLSMEPTEDIIVSKPIHVLNFSLTDDVGLVSLFFECAELTPPWNQVSFHCDEDYDLPSILDHVVSKVANIFNTYYSSGALGRCGLNIEPGEITYTSFLDPCPSGTRPQEHVFHFRISVTGLPALSFNFDRLFSAFLPIPLYDQVVLLTIPLPAFNLIHYELGEEIVIAMLRRFSNVRILNGVGPVLWDLLYRWAQPLDDDKRLILPSLGKIVFHRACLPTPLDTNGDVCTSVSDSASEEGEEDAEEVDQKLATAVLISPEELFPESDSEDASFRYESGHIDYTDIGDSTEFSEPPIRQGLPLGTINSIPYSWDEYYDIGQQYINSREVLEFCRNRPAVHTIVISSPHAAHDKDSEAFRLVLREVGVSVEFGTGK